MPPTLDSSMELVSQELQDVFNTSNLDSNFFVQNVKKISIFTMVSALHHGNTSKKNNVSSHSQLTIKEEPARFPTAKAISNGVVSNAITDLI